ncbi:MAG: Asp-tRNA(Asn)/Glu-tRNA(Gln) amidotransferase subunit GatB [Bacteroidales bacterium]
MDHIIQIGLEVHIQLKTRSKLFSPEPYLFGNEPNYFIDPVTTGLPGTLPSFNQKVLDFALILATALNCKINQQITFDRKNYFYPDLPKGYQITQKTNPVGYDGTISFVNHKKQLKSLKIHQVHIEEDSAKSSYKNNDRMIDYNRAGVPLLEIVTAPELKSPEEAAAFIDYLKIMIKELGISDGEMEKGAIRCDANVSVNKFHDQKGYNEIKNLNSTKELKTALKQEIKRQQQEFVTNNFKRGFTLNFKTRPNNISFSRKKDDLLDYAYINEPDILPVYITEQKISKLKSDLPKLPAERFKFLLEKYSIRSEAAYVISINKKLFILFEHLISDVSDPAELIHFLLGPFLSLHKKHPDQFNNLKLLQSNILILIDMISDGRISRENAYQKLWPKLIFSKNKTTFDIAKENDLFINNSDEALFSVIRKTIENYPNEVNAYNNGKNKVLGFFIGQIMKITENRFQAKKIKQLLIDELKNQKI